MLQGVWERRRGKRPPERERLDLSDLRVVDPERVRLIVRAVAEELGKADTAHAIDYRKRATEIDESLAAPAMGKAWECLHVAGPMASPHGQEDPLSEPFSGWVPRAHQ